ncbi:MAG: hypothetical protein M5U26_08265 [Planctomycetota bacterium]|nr:hypothetical protein [Planctomycetota bacterium]
MRRRDARRRRRRAGHQLRHLPGLLRGRRPAQPHDRAPPGRPAPALQPPRPLKQDEFWQAVKKVEPDAYERVLKHMQAYDPRELPEPLHGDVRCLVRRAVEAQVELSPYLQALLRLLPENRVPGSEPRVPSAPGQRSGPGPLDAPRSEA